MQEMDYNTHYDTCKGFSKRREGGREGGKKKMGEGGRERQREGGGRGRTELKENDGMTSGEVLGDSE